jgi:hypothetical protein
VLDIIVNSNTFYLLHVHKSLHSKDPGTIPKTDPGYLLSTFIFDLSTPSLLYFSS